ncbi:D-alanine--D-alanine ligase [Candidatus Margulisiibacteriota bacterium]
MIKKLQNKLIGVIAGGLSAEREVSLRSGKKVHQALRELGYKTKFIDPAFDSIENSSIDIAFIALHGWFGEDGNAQSILKSFNIPHTGSGVHASILGMNKLLTKKLLLKNSIPTPEFQMINKFTDKINLTVPFPCIIKPIDQGSSVDVAIINSIDEFNKAAPAFFAKYTTGILERYIPGKEITVGLLEINKKTIALPVLELRPKNKFYDYEAKYTKGLTEFILPATINEEETILSQKYAIKAHQSLGCRGFSRVDMIIDAVFGPKVLEVNTIPGMTELSDLPAQASAYGLSYNQLVETILCSVLDK